MKIARASNMYSLDKDTSTEEYLVDTKAFLEAKGLDEKMYFLNGQQVIEEENESVRKHIVLILFT